MLEMVIFNISSSSSFKYTFYIKIEKKNKQIAILLKLVSLSTSKHCAGVVFVSLPLLKYSFFHLHPYV